MDGEGIGVVADDEQSMPPADPAHPVPAPVDPTAGEEQIGDPRVLAAIERLADLEGLPVAEQVEIFADVHARLTEALGTESADTTVSYERASSGQATIEGVSP